MKKHNVWFIFAVVCFIVSCLLQGIGEVLFAIAAFILFFFRSLQKSWQTKNPKEIMSVAFFLFLFFGFLYIKKETFFLFYICLERVRQILFDKITSSYTLTLSYKEKQKQKVFFVLFLFFFLLLLLFPHKREQVFAYILTSFLLLKERNWMYWPCIFKEASLHKLQSRHILFHKDNVLAKMAICDAIVVTKTGVLTEEAIQLETVIPVYKTKEEIVKYASILEARSNHPLAQAFPKIDENHTLSLIHPMKGKGIRGIVDEIEIVLGSGMLFEELNIKYPRVSFLHPTMMIAMDGTYVGTFVFQEELKKDLSFFFPLLKEEGIEKSTLLSSTSKEQVKKIASHLSIQESYANLTLEDKIAFLKNESRQHHILYVDDVYQSNEIFNYVTLSISIKPNAKCDIELPDGDINHILFLRKEARKLKTRKQFAFYFFSSFFLVSILFLWFSFQNIVLISLMHIGIEIAFFSYLKRDRNNTEM